MATRPPSSRDGANRLVGEQLVATDMQAAQSRDLEAGIQLMNDHAGEGDVDIHIASPDRLYFIEA
jgi:hypothetical protein